jgi:hypothetical protein
MLHISCDISSYHDILISYLQQEQVTRRLDRQEPAFLPSEPRHLQHQWLRKVTYRRAWAAKVELEGLDGVSVVAPMGA